MPRPSIPVRVPTLLAVLLALPLPPAVHAQQPPSIVLPPVVQPRVATTLDALAALELTAAQRLALLAIAADAAALRADIAEGVDAALAAADAELASPDADLRAMAALHEAALDARLAEVRALRDRLIDFYEHELDPAQQDTARELMRSRLQAFARLRDALVELRAAIAQP